MTGKDIEFINEFNEYYPFERYILKEPKKINYLFDDILLTELFIPSTEIKPVIDERTGQLICHTSVPKDEIYVKFICGVSEIRLAFTDFSNGVREEIRWDVIRDFGDSEWQDLYVENEDYSDLKEALSIQKKMITEKYGDCNIKDNFKIKETKEIVKTL